jgi:hypothetical protein
MAGSYAQRYWYGYDDEALLALAAMTLADLRSGNAGRRAGARTGTADRTPPSRCVATTRFPNRGTKGGDMTRPPVVRVEPRRIARPPEETRHATRDPRLLKAA